MMTVSYKFGSVVWVRIGQKWWPGTITTLERCPLGYSMHFKKEPLAIVKFFNENEYIDVNKKEHILSFNCSKKIDFIRKGLNAIKHDEELLKKFEFDVAMAEKLTGGNVNIIEELKETTKRRIDYSDLGFGLPKVKKVKDECRQREGFSDIGESIQYKKGSTPPKEYVVLEHQIKILEQPKQEASDSDVKSASFWFKCHICGYTCTRLNVIVWHNKAHLKKVADFDSGIRIPGRRKRKQNTPRSNKNKRTPKVDHQQTNGHVSPSNRIPGAQDLLQDWDDDQEEQVPEEQVEQVQEEAPSDAETPPTNGHGPSQKLEADPESDYDDNYPPPVPKRERQPMPNQEDIDTAFDALLAETSGSGITGTPNSQNSTYLNNDSDSEYSDWEKYYEKESDSVSFDEKESENDLKSLEDGELNDVKHQNGECEEHSNSEMTSEESSQSEPKEDAPNKEVNEDIDKASVKPLCEEISEDESKDEVESRVDSILTEQKESSVTASDPDESSSNTAADDPLPESISSTSKEEPPQEQQSASQSVGHSSASNSSSSSAYMLVAVDAQGNNVPMPVLSEGGNHLVAVEASMEDGTTRTLYIDPAHLGPNVDLSNLMLHIDNSGQETVIIPTSSADGEIVSSTLVEQQETTSVESAPTENKTEK